ncbi:MAG: ABC transporter ATP-binding protein [Candidatus Tectomicrobia bacterium]|nr:ABC transporter ATP-binding protein [Candidatus Tectomicrobia bacterium]
MSQGASHFPHLVMRGITKRFPGVVANDEVDLQVAKGEIHALLGENGAGKTTLMNILYGLYRPDAGEIAVGGQGVRLNRPSDAMARGIGMVHQHFMLVPVMTVTENIILGQETTRCGPFLARKQAAQHIRELSRQYHLDVDPQAVVQDLSVGMRQRVEILKALYRRADILILDEPTAVLTPAETLEVFRTLTALAQQGTAIIFITHKLKDVLQIAHRITVMRGGRVVGAMTPVGTTEAQLASLMVGGQAPQPVVSTPRQHASTEVVLRVQNLRASDDRGAVAVDGVSLAVHAGEVLGIAGVQGNGQTELVEVLTGLRPAMTGAVAIDGVEVTRATPRRMASQGVAHIPEDRHKYGIVDRYSVADNLVLNTYRDKPFARGIVRRTAAVIAHARQLMERFDIRAPSPFTSAGSLSGGNQQKMVVAREFARPIRLLIAAQPTRGLDVGAMTFLHQQLLEKRDQGCAVLLISTELDEIMALSDHIAVMYRGRILATLPAPEATRESLGQLMAGVGPVC